MDEFKDLKPIVMNPPGKEGCTNCKGFGHLVNCCTGERTPCKVCFPVEYEQAIAFEVRRFSLNRHSAVFFRNRE